jgi:ATP-dependent helicase/nuclease subunit B
MRTDPSLFDEPFERFEPSQPSGPEAPSIERVFLGWDEPLLPRAAAHLIRAHARRLPDAPFPTLDLSHLRVALPGRRAANRLLERLLDAAQAEGCALLPPDLCTVGELPERLHPPVRPIPGPEITEAAWRAALRSLPDDRIRVLVPSPPPADALPQWGTLARTVAQLHTLLGAEGIRFADVARRCAARDLLHDDERRWEALARAQAEFNRLLLAEGFEDRESWRASVLEGAAVPSPTPTPLLLIGLVDLPGVARRVIERWAGPVEVLVHAPAELADDFDALGVVLPERWEGRPLPIPPRALRVVGRPEAQADAVVDWLRGLEGRYPAEAIVVGVPDPEVVPFLSGRFAAAGVPFRSAAGRPLHRSVPYRLLDGVARYLDGRRFEDLAALLRHPDALHAVTAGTELEREALVAALDRFHARSLPAFFSSGRIPQGPEGGGGGGAGAGGTGAGGTGAGGAHDPDAEGSLRSLLLGLQRALDALLPDPGRPRPLSQWAPEIRALLVRLYPAANGTGVRAVDRTSPQDRELVRFLDLARSALEGLEEVPHSLDRDAASMATALRMLLSRIGGESVPEPGDEGAVELLGWLELPLDDAPALVLTGVNEPFLPESVTGDPFLPHALRAGLGLPDNRRRRARDLMLLSSILACREDVLLISGRRDGSGNPLRPSRLLLADTPEVVAARILERLADDEPRPAPAPSGGTEEVPPSPLRLPPEPVLSHPGGAPDRLAVTRFRALLADPYRYALESVLELNAETDEAREMDPMVFGNLAHAVLEGWARTPGADQASESEIAARLDVLLDRTFDTWFGARPLPALHIQREQLRLRLRSYAALQGQRNRDGWRIAAVEARPAGEGVPFLVDGVPILLRGRIDRVDHHPQLGRWQLLDVKTSEIAKKPDEVHRRGRGPSRVWVDLQLPLYRILARGLRSGDGTSPLIPEAAPLETGYLLVPGDEASLELSPWTAEELDDAEATAQEVVRTLRANRFEWDPETTTIRVGDPFAGVVGRGILDLGGSAGGDDA